MTGIVRRGVVMWIAVGLMLALPVAGCGSNGAENTEAHIRAGSASLLDAYRVYRVPSGSMEPTLPIGTRVTLKKGSPAVGAVVVFHPPRAFAFAECGPKRHMVKPGGAACDTPAPRHSATELIKRVVAGPGGRIYIRHGHVYRETRGSRRFVRERDPYIRACGHRAMCNFPVPIKVPAHHWFLMGDNRGASLDSRSWGPVPSRWIVGLAAKLECLMVGPHRIRWVHRTVRQGCVSHTKATQKTS